MVASSSGSRCMVLHHTGSTGKIDYYENMNSDMANAYFKPIRVRY